MKNIKIVIFRLLCVTNILLTYHAAAYGEKRRMGQCPEGCNSCRRPPVHLCGAPHLHGPQGLYGLRGLPFAFLKAYLTAQGIGLNNFLASQNLYRPGGIGFLPPGKVYGPGGIRFLPGEFGIPGFRPGGPLQGGFGPGYLRPPGSFGIGPGGIIYGVSRPGRPRGIIHLSHIPGLDGITHEIFGNGPRDPTNEGIPQFIDPNTESIIPGNTGNGPGGITQGEIAPDIESIVPGNNGNIPEGIIQGGIEPNIESIVPGNTGNIPGGIIQGGIEPDIESIVPGITGNILGGIIPGGIIQGGIGPDIESIVPGNTGNIAGGIIQGGIRPDIESIVPGNTGNRPGGIIQGEIEPEAKGITASPADTVQGGITQGDIGSPEGILQGFTGPGLPGIGKDVSAPAGIFPENTDIRPEGVIPGGIGPEGIDPAEGSIGMIPDRIIQGGNVPGAGGLPHGITGGIIQGGIEPGAGGMVPDSTGGIIQGGNVPGPGGIIQGNPGGFIQGGNVPGASGIIQGSTGGNTHGNIGTGSGDNMPGDINFGGINNGNIGLENFGSGVINPGMSGSGMIVPGGGVHSGNIIVENIGTNDFGTGGIGIEGNGIKEIETGDIGPEGIAFGGMGADFTGTGANFIRAKDNQQGPSNFGINGINNFASGTLPSGSNHFNNNHKIFINYDNKIKNELARSQNLKGFNSYEIKNAYNGQNPGMIDLSNLKSNVYLSNTGNFNNNNNETSNIGSVISDTNLPIAREREPSITSDSKPQSEAYKQPLNNAVPDTNNMYTVALQLDGGNKLQPIILNENQNSTIMGNNSFIPFPQGIQITYGGNSQDDPQMIQQPLQGFYPVNTQDLRDNPGLQESILKRDALGKRTLVKVFHFKGNDLTGGKVYDFKDGVKAGKIYHIKGKDVNGSNILYDGENITDFLFGDPLFGEHGLGMHKINLDDLIKEIKRDNRNITDQEAANLGDTTKQFPLRTGGMVIKEYPVDQDGQSNEDSEGKVTQMIQKFLNGKKMEALRMGNRSQDQSTEEVNEKENAIFINKAQLDEQNDITGLERLSEKIGAIEESNLSNGGNIKGATRTIGILDTVKDRGVSEILTTIGEGSSGEEDGIRDGANVGEGRSITVEAETGSDEDGGKKIEITHRGGFSGGGTRGRVRIELGGDRKVDTTEKAVLGLATGVTVHGEVDIGRGEDGSVNKGAETANEEGANGRQKIFGIGFRTRTRRVTGINENFDGGAGALVDDAISNDRGNRHMGLIGFGFKGRGGVSGRIKNSDASSERIGLNKGLYLDSTGFYRRKKGHHHENRVNRHDSGGRRSHNRKTGYRSS